MLRKFPTDPTKKAYFPRESLFLDLFLLKAKSHYKHKRMKKQSEKKMFLKCVIFADLNTAPQWARKFKKVQTKKTREIK